MGGSTEGVRHRARHTSAVEPFPAAASRQPTFRRLTHDSSARTDYSNLSLLSRAVIDAFLRLRDRDREFMVALEWLGFSTTSIEIQHRERHHGQSSYTLRRLIRVAVDGMFFRTTVLLRLVVLTGFVIALCGLLLAGFEVVDYFTAPDRRIPGYTSLAVLVFVLSGVIIVSVGVVGMYVGRIFEQVKDRPLYLIDAEASGADDASREGPREIAAESPQPLAPRT